MKCDKRNNLWRRDVKTESNIGSNGDGISLEVPTTTDLWKADSAFIHWAMEWKTQAEIHDWKLMTWWHKLTLTQLKTDSILKHNWKTGKDAQSRAYSIQPTLIVPFITWSSEMEQPMQPCKHPGCYLISSQVLSDVQEKGRIERQLPWKLGIKLIANKLTKHELTGWIQEYCERIFINIAIDFH